MVGSVGEVCLLSSNRFQLCVIDLNQSEMLGTIIDTGCFSLSDFHSTAFPHSSSSPPLPPSLCSFSSAHFEKELGRHEEEKVVLTNLLPGCTHPISISMNQQKDISVTLHGVQTDTCWDLSLYLHYHISMIPKMFIL